MYHRGKFGNMVPTQRTADQQGGGASSQTQSDFVVRFTTAQSSSLHAETGGVQYSITGIMGFDGVAGEPASVAFDDGTAAEGTNDAETYTAPGIIGRPLPPRTVNGQALHMDVICIQTVEGLVPIAYRDLRLQMAGDSAPGEGVLAFVGYGGGFLSQTPVADGDDPAGGGTIQVMYCPYDFDSNGIAQKAHSIILDPTSGNESITIAHGDGQAIMMFDGELTLKSPDGTAYISIKNDSIDFIARTCTFNAGVVIGDSATAVPLLAGAASPPSTKLFVSP